MTEDRSAAKPDFDTTQATRDVLRAQESIAAQGHSDYRDVPWWARWIYWRSEWLRGVCRDAWSFRRLRDLEFEREDAEVRALAEEDDHAVT
jgi:hypothetical protein